MRILFIAALFFVHIGAGAQAPISKVTDFLNESGWSSQTPKFKTGIREAMMPRIEADLQSLSKGDKQKAYASFDADLEAEMGAQRFNDMIRQAVSREWSESVISDGLKFFRTELGKKIVALESLPTPSNLMSPSKQVEVGRKIFNASSKSRQDLLVAVTKEMNGAAFYVDLSYYASWGLMSGAANADARSSLDEDLKKFKSLRKSMIDARATEEPMQAALIYQELNEAELTRFIAFMRTPSARKISDVMHRVLPAVMQNRTEAFGARLAANRKSV
jgi:hypothetical protein